MLADSFSVFSIHYIARGLRGCNIIADSFLYKCHPSFMEQTLL